jgi:hypothetical protein
MKRIIILLSLSLTLAQVSFSQIEAEFREVFLEAESEFLFEEYAEALPNYENLNRQYPDNDNINFKIGVCLLNNPYRKGESIRFLEKSVLNVNPKYKENSFREIQAPLEAFFYLGNAYRVNSQLEKAIETYMLFKDKADPELYDLDLVDEQIQACRNAMELKDRPVDIDMRNMGDVVNSRNTESNFVVSADESVLVYVQKLAFYDAPLFAEKVDGQWSYPRNLIASGELGPGVDDDVYPVALSYDGDEMIIYRSDDFIGDLYTSRLVDGFWTPIQKMNDNINTKYWESHASFTASGDTLYFTSNRKGTIGGLDIYISIKGEDGEWGLPENLGPTINTKYNEETPVITADGNTLYFSSYGHHNMGGYDVFYSNKLEDGQWSVPVNAGYPINTSDDDISYIPVQNGNFAYYPRFLEGGFGRTDIYLLEVYNETHPRKFQIRGILGTGDLESMTQPVRIAVIEQFSRDTVAIAFANAETGEYEFEVVQGKYDLLIEGEDIETTTYSFVIPEGYIQKEMELTESILLTQAKRLEDLIPKIVDNIIVTDTLIHVSTDDSLDILLTLEKNSQLFVKTYHDTLQSLSDSFRVAQDQFTYSFKPYPGDNLLKFKMIDTLSRLSFKDIQVIYTPAIAEELAADTTPVSVETETIHLQSELVDLSSGVLKDMLGNLDLASEGISTEEELLIYLREHADEYNYDSQDVYDLIRKKMQIEYLGDYRDELIRLTDDESLRRALEEIDTNDENINSLQDLYEAILLEADTYGYEEEKVNELFSVLSQREEMNELIGDLSSIASGDLQKVITNLDVEAEGINSPVEFMSYLLDQANKYDYSQDEAMSLLLNYLEGKDLREIVKVLIATSSGDLQTLLMNLDLGVENLSSLSSLYNYLIDQANYHDFTDVDVMKLFLNLLKVLEDQPLVSEIEVPSTDDSRERTGGTWQFYVLGGLLLVIILFFIGRRRKSDRSQDK